VLAKEATIEVAAAAVTKGQEVVQEVETEIALEAVTDHVQAKAATEALVQAAAVTAETALQVREVVQAEIEIVQELETNISFYM
jgi:hypothetical protein